jgi:predicted phosphodiesterase
MEKYAVMSDIHSNIFALKAVVADAKAKGITKFVNLGDILYGPIAPKETFDYLIEQNFITISGNQDRQIYEATAEEITSNPTMEYILNDLGEAPLTWMKSLPFDLQINDDIYLCHGTPKDDLVYLLEDVSSGSAKVRKDQDILNLLAGQKSKIILCGHTHTPRCVQLSTGQMIINPGSVGLQAYSDDEPFKHSMENFSPKASYAILEQSKNTHWDVSFLKVGYDVNSAVNAAHKQNRDDWGHFLSTGRAV